MKNEFTAIIERDEEWYIAFCPEIPEANGQGATKDEARELKREFGRGHRPRTGRYVEISQFLIYDDPDRPYLRIPMRLF